MKASIRNVTPDNIKDIPAPCRTCLYWESPEHFNRRKGLSPTEEIECEAEKAAWFLKALKEFGNCGKILYANNTPVGYVQYCTSTRLLNTQNYGSKKLRTKQENVVFISCLYITDEKFRGRNLGERLLKEVLSELKRRGFKAVETFAREGSANNPSGPREFYLKNGFQTTERLAPDFALVKLDL